MFNLIKVTPIRNPDSKILVNPAHIVDITLYTTGEYKLTLTETRSYLVRESPEQIVTLVRQAYLGPRETIKTKAAWEQSGFLLTDYLTGPCEIDEDLYNYVGEVVAPHYCSQTLTQGGDPEYSEPSFNDDEKIFFYTTVSEVNGKYYYLGILPEFRQ